MAPRIRTLIVLAILSLLSPALHAKEVTLEADDDVRVFGTFREAVGEGRGIVLLFHQARSNRHEYDPTIPVINRAGFDTLAIDQRSGGEMWGRENETVDRLGRSRDYLDAYADMAAALAWAERQGYTTVVAVGSSYSASLVFRLAAENPKSIDAVASFSPGEYFKDRPDYVKNHAAKVAVPIFATCAGDENERLDEVLRKADGERVTRFRQEKGVHGASALRRDRNPQGYDEVREAFIGFLKKAGE